MGDEHGGSGLSHNNKPKTTHEVAAAKKEKWKKHLALLQEIDNAQESIHAMKGAKLKRLYFPGSSRILVQIGCVVLIVLAAVFGYRSTQGVIAGMQTISLYPNDRLVKLPMSVLITFAVVAIIPAVFIFMSLREELTNNVHKSHF